MICMAEQAAGVIDPGTCLQRVIEPEIAYRNKYVAELRY